jgi:hypothetical protein
MSIDLHSRLRMTRPAIASLAIAVLVSPAVAQKAERPVVNVGDWWQFVQYYNVPSAEPNRHWRISAVTDSRIEGTENGELLALTPDLNVLESPRDTSSNPMLLRFPLETGGKWHFTSEWTFKPTGSTGVADIDVEVVGYEKISVPAGNFDAFKLTSKAGLRGASPKGSRIEAVAVSTYWYAPAARAIVKSITHNPYIGVSTVELVKFNR